MDGSQGVVVSGDAVAVRFPQLVDTLSILTLGARGLSISRLPDQESLVVTKTVPGFDAATIAALRGIVREAAAGRLGRMKYLAFDLAHEAFALSNAEEGFVDLLVELESLILAAPIVSVTFARADLAGADLEFALGCSMIVAGAGRRFSFIGDPLVSMGAYALLAQKIGFVLAERLMEKGDIIDADRMYELCLVKEVLKPGDSVESFLTGALRKHNASYGIYRAQRIATGSAHLALRAADLA